MTLRRKQVGKHKINVSHVFFSIVSVGILNGEYGENLLNNQYDGKLLHYCLGKLILFLSTLGLLQLVTK